jgi:hypothetical protein
MLFTLQYSQNVFHVEAQKRATETGVVAAIRRALENEGVVFVPGRCEKSRPATQLRTVMTER